MPSSEQRHTGVRLVVEWLLYLALWVVAVGKVDRGELLFAAVGATLGCTATAAVRRCRDLRFALDFRSFLEAWRLPKYAFTGTWEVLLVLYRQLFLGQRAPSLFRTVPFESPADPALAATRRALAIAYTTATPNFVVVGIDREKGLLLYHQVEAGPVLPMTERLGARP